MGLYRLALVVVLLVAATGAWFSSASSASAQAPPFTVATPSNDAIYSLDMPFSGSGLPNGAVRVCTQLPDQSFVEDVVAIDANGNFSGSVHLSQLPMRPLQFEEIQSLNFDFCGSINGGVLGDIFVTLIPPAFLVSTPVDNATLDSLDVAFSGTGLPGGALLVCAVLADGQTQDDFFGIDATGTFGGSVHLRLAPITPLQFQETQAPGTSTCGDSSNTLGRIQRTLVQPPFVLATPLDNVTLESFNVPVSGTGLPGGGVRVCTNLIDGTTQELDLAIDANGNFSGSLPLRVPAFNPLPFEETLFPGICGSTGQPLGPPFVVAALSRTVTLPPVPLAVTAPVDNASLSNVVVAMTGTGLPNGEVRVCAVLPSGGTQQLGNLRIDGSGNFSGSLRLAELGTSVLTYQEVDDFQVLGQPCGPGALATLTRTVTVQPAGFVVTTPADTATVFNFDVPFSGSGVPGGAVQVCALWPDGATVLGQPIAIDASGSFVGVEQLGLGGTTRLQFLEIQPGQGRQGQVAQCGSSQVAGVLASVVRLVTLSLPPAFVVATPLDNATLGSPSVPLSGTGLPGGGVRSCAVLPDGTTEFGPTLAIDASGNFSGSISLALAGTSRLQFEEVQAPLPSNCGDTAITGILADVFRTITIAPSVTLTINSTPVQPLEGSAFNGVVASFTDPGAGPYVVTIDWGDGQSSNGSVATSCAGGVCTVQVTGAHHYDRVGTYTMQVHAFSPLAGGQVSTQVIVADAPLEAPQGRTIDVASGQVFNGILAGFADPNVGAVPPDFSIAISWGDSTSSVGTVEAVSPCCANSTAAFNIVGSHTYAVAGTYNVAATVTDIAGGTASTPNALTTHSVMNATIAAFNADATEGAFFQTELARIPMLDVRSGFQKTIDWGDGTIDGPAPVAQGCFRNAQNVSECFWLAGGGHTYAEEGVYTTTTTFAGADGSAGSASSVITVGDAQLTDVRGNILPVSPGTRFDGLVATFRDPSPFAVAADFSATVDWGDGSTSSAGVVAASGCCSGSFFQIVGTHVYASAGGFTVHTRLSDSGGATAVATGSAGGLQVTLAPLTFTAGAPTPLGFLVATFQTRIACSDFGAPAYTDTISWGDGTTSTGGIASNGGCAGTFSVGDRHTYAVGGYYPITITVSGSNGTRGSALEIVTVNPVSGPLSNAVPVIGALGPDGTIQASGGLTLIVTGTGFVSGSVARWNGADLSTTVLSQTMLAVVVPAADVATPTDLATATVTVFNPLPGGGTSNELPFTISSAQVKRAASAIAPGGGTASASTAPTSGDAGVAVDFTNTATSSTTLTAATYVGNPTGTAVFDAGGGFTDVQLRGAALSGSVAARFYYPSAVTGAAEAGLQLKYCNGSAWVNVRGSGNAAPVQDTTDNLDGSVSGGRFSVTLDSGSTPPVSALSGTVFTLTDAPIATPTPTATATSTPTATATSTPTAMATSTPTATATSTPTATATSTPTATATSTPTALATSTPTATATSTPTGTPPTPTATPTPGEIGSGGGGDGGPPNPGATPELDSLLLFGSGLAGLAAFARARFLARRRRRDR